MSPSNEYSGLISFSINWVDLLAVLGTLKSLLQHHSSKASIFLHSAFFMVQLSHPYLTTGKTIALTRRPFVGKVISLLFNMLSTLVIAFLPRTKRLLISQLQSPSAVILEPPKIKSLTVSIVSPSICCEVMGPDAMIQTLTDHYYMPDFRKHYHLHFPHLRSLVQNVYPQAFDKEEWQLTQLSWPFRFLLRTFQVAQGLKIHLPRQETWV